MMAYMMDPKKMPLLLMVDPKEMPYAVSSCGFEVDAV
jgi:hypothetical protein